MSDFQYDQNVFAFEKSELWDTVVFILKQNIDTETADALSPLTTGESRIHACGRANALTDILSILESERKEALHKKRIDII